MSKPIPSATVATSAFISPAISASSSALALLGRERRVVGTGVDAARAEPGGDPLRVGDGQAVDDAAAGQVRQVLREPRQPLGLVGERDRPEPERRPCQRAADDPDALPELLGHVRDDPVVGRRRRREDRDRRREAAQDPPDPPVVGPEVVAPVADAVRLVDDEQADRSLDRGQDPVREGLVAEALGRDQQDVDRVGREPRLDVVPLGRVARVDRRGVEAQPAGHRDLVAHEREERADDERRPVALVAADPRRDPVDEALAPARALDDERPLPVADHGLDRLALAFAEVRVGTEHRSEVVVERRGGGLHARQACHARMSKAALSRRRQADLAAKTGSVGDPSVERDQRRFDRFGQRDIPPVVGGQIVAKLPHARRDRLVRIQVHTKGEQIVMGKRRDIGRDATGENRPAEDVRGFDRQQMRSDEVLPAQFSLSPVAVRADVDQCGDGSTRVDDDRHDRSASRCSRIAAAGSRLCVLVVRVRARVSKSSTEGRRASWMSSVRRCSWSDRPARAALAASSSRTSSGTFRTVIDVMHAVWC